MEICKEMGIEWDSNATCATVGGKPIPENLTMEDIFQNAYEELSADKHFSDECIKPIFKIEIELYPNSESPKNPYFWTLRWNHGKNWCNFNAGWAATPEEAWADGYKYYTEYCRREGK